MEQSQQAALQPGTPIHGGFFAGIVQVDGQRYGVVVAPKSARIPERQAGVFGTVPGAMHLSDGMANTKAMAEAGSSLAASVLALNLNGFQDWHIPARDELELIYRNLKPTRQVNWCSLRDGENPSSLPFGTPYTEESPAQTTVAEFQAGGAEAIMPVSYWSSTQDSAELAFSQDFADGHQVLSYEDVESGVIPVRRFLIHR